MTEVHDEWGDMGLAGTLGKLLFLVRLFGLCPGYEQEACSNFRLQFERVLSVPGDVAMLSSTLVSPDIFNLSAVPYNITWYRLTSSQPIINVSGRFLVRGETLWFLNVTLADDGEYVTIVRTPLQCYRQDTKLIVDQPNPEECGRPRRAGQSLTRGVTDKLSCPLKDYIHKLNSYGIPSSIRWYKGCELISDGTERFSYWDTYLKISGVESDDEGLYTCTLKFTLAGVNGSLSETIDAEVKGDYFLVPEVREPANDIIKAPVGSNFTKRCLVFVPCVGEPSVDVLWLVREDFIFEDPSERIYTTEQRVVERQDKGVLLERWLIIPELKDEDHYLNYTCRAYNARGNSFSYFTLLPTDSMSPWLVVALSCLLIVVSVFIYIVLKPKCKHKLDCILPRQNSTI